MVVKDGGTFVKSPRVRGPSEAELLAIQMMAELVAKRAQERAERGHLLAHSGTRPYADGGVSKRIIPEQLDLPSSFAHAQGPSCERTNVRSLHAVKGSCCSQKIGAGLPNLVARAFLHDSADNLCQLRKRPVWR